MIKIVISGAAGRMGARILELAAADSAVDVTGIFESNEFASREFVFRNKRMKIGLDAEKTLAASDVLIEFTNPSATLEHLSAAVQSKKPVVIGTTGFTAEENEIIKKASKKIPVVLAPNMSVGINLLFKLLKEVSATLKDYDVEIVELHHNQKKDAPSGTAMKLSDIIADVMGSKRKIYGREGMVGPRKKDEMGVHAVRAGDIVGEHTVYFAGPGERIELTHRAHSRDCFASGAIMAAKWVVNKEPGLYTMQDVLGL